MKTGIILIFHNNERDINSEIFIKDLQQTENIELCLVNNDSKDDTFRILQEIKEACKNVSVVNIKKFKSDISAVRAGARFMFNNFDMSHIGYVSTLEFNNKYLRVNDLIKLISENREDIIRYHMENLYKRQVKQTMFQKIFSVLDYLRKMEDEAQIVNLH